ncbi:MULTISPECIES: type VI secretion system Vgr family protein [unclassified Janthinobacterium]|uniref:type VI secretion system Vgr family protein n=1 Tax=unclassified Janthinobacterium TaxID=2610881 RepID=UPI000886E021|nr:MULTISPECIES: type VI secretion system tip protein TssI/VgrG [unclassified Janthinobacterium]SDA54120.1 type VI secretion system secreted protein VgrG [Janthinobacterium sp. 551a]SFB45521.1 type VI secretion system secreted protein VgrG [Janthinobacterium sp. 344]
MNFFDGDTIALAAMADDMQGDRLLRLHFPDGDAPANTLMLVNSLDASESLSRDFSYVVEVLSDDAAIALDKIMGKMVAIALVREDGTLRYFNGYVFEFRFLRTDGGFAWYEMVLEPWLAHLHLRQNNVAFHGLTVAALTDKVFEDYLMRDYKLAATGIDPAITYTCQHNESDHNLLHRHWEQLGWHYRYEHRLDGHTLWLSDDSGSGKAIDGELSSMPFQHQAGSSEDDGVHNWSTVRRMAPAQMTLASFNFKNPRSARASRDSLNRQGAVPALEIYENTGSYGFKNIDDGEALAQRRMEERDAQGQLFEAQGNDRTAQPGRWFTLDGHFNTATTGNGGKGASEYLILSVHHHASNNYQQGSHATSHYSNTFTCIERAIAWRPGRNFHSREPKIYGVQTATVVGPPGEEIYTDGYGRVKVQFHWDRLGKFDDKSSPWIRVISNWAGPNFGHISLPRVGMEVAVQFLDGNVAMPIIIGCVYNARNMPPWDLPANKTQSGMLSRSSKKGSAAHANALRFEDRKDAEELWLHAEKDQRIEVEHDESHWVGNDRRKTVDRDETVHVKRNRTETVGHDEDITVHNNRKERVDRDEHIDIGKNRTEVVGKNESVRIVGFRTEKVDRAKTETITLAKVLNIGGAYAVTVGAVMHTMVVGAKYLRALRNVIKIAEKMEITAGTEFEVTVGQSHLSMCSDGKITITGSDITIGATGPVQINGHDVDIN